VSHTSPEGRGPQAKSPRAVLWSFALVSRMAKVEIDTWSAIAHPSSTAAKRPRDRK